MKEMNELVVDDGLIVQVMISIIVVLIYHIITRLGKREESG